MGYYSDFYLQFENIEPSSLQVWFEKTYGYKLHGGGVFGRGNTLEIQESKWYHFEEDIMEWLRTLDSADDQYGPTSDVADQVSVQALRIGEAGMAEDMIAYHFRRGAFVKQKIDMHEFMETVWQKGSIWAGPLSRG